MTNDLLSLRNNECLCQSCRLPVRGLPHGPFSAVARAAMDLNAMGGKTERFGRYGAALAICLPLRPERRILTLEGKIRGNIGLT
jgi:hypothetical protein